MAQDYYDILQPFDFLLNLLDDNKATLGIRYIAQNDEVLRPEYPAVHITAENTLRELHATQMHRVVWFIDIWVFHAELTVGKAVRSRQDIELATNVRKLIHTKRDMDGHIVHGFVASEAPGISARTVGRRVSTVVTTRMSWQGENRVLYQDS